MTPRHQNPEGTTQIAVRVPNHLLARVDKLAKTDIGELTRTQVVIRALAVGIAALERKR